MILTQKDIWSAIGEAKPSQTQLPDENTLLSHITKKFSICASEELKSVVNRQMNLYKKRDRCGVASSSTVFTSDEAPPMKNFHTRSIRKSFVEVKTQMQNKRSDDLLKLIKDYLIKNENFDGEDPVFLTQILGHLIQQVNYSKDKKNCTN